MDSNTEKYLVQPVLSGAAAFAFTYVVFGNQGSIPVAGMEMSPAMAFGLIAAGSDAVGTLVSDEIEKANGEEAFDETIKLMVKPALSGAAMVTASRVLIGPYADNAAIGKVAALGAASSVSGEYGKQMIPK
jgi:hypothetical protein